MSEVLIYCPECKAEYREGFMTCSSCDVPLVRRLESDETERLVPLAHETSFEFVAELLDRLEKANVPYVIEAGTALRMLDDEADPVTEPESWEARVWVTRNAEGAAMKIHRELWNQWKFGLREE
ncbi:MAG: hypothetical protein JOZ54_11440 [Acidobacteria bacterium]|nr:hypothetical protein [Acidobacteriota bacterium]